MEKILLGVDLSRSARLLGIFASSLYRIGIKEIIVSHILDVRLMQEMAQTMMDFAKDHLEGIREAITNIAPSMNVSTDLRVGAPYMGLAEAAIENSCDMIVVGSHGDSLKSHISLGSLTQAMLFRSYLPLLIVRVHSESYGSHIAPLKGPILFPTDFSTAAEASFPTLMKINNRLSGEIIILHVQDEKIVTHMNENDLKKCAQADIARLERLEADIKSEGFKALYRIDIGNPVKRICEVAKEEDIGLVLMGTKGRNNLKRFFLGATAENVARNTSSHILLVPGPQKEV